MTLTLDFYGQILLKLYPRNGMADRHETKGMWVDRKLDPLVTLSFDLTHDLGLRFFKVKFWISRISGMGWRIEWNEKDESIRSWNHSVTLSYRV